MPLCIIAHISWRKPKYINFILFLFPHREWASRSNVFKRVDRVGYVISISHLCVFSHLFSAYFAKDIVCATELGRFWGSTDVFSPRLHLGCAHGYDLACKHRSSSQKQRISSYLGNLLYGSYLFVWYRESKYRYSNCELNFEERFVAFLVFLIIWINLFFAWKISILL